MAARTIQPGKGYSITYSSPPLRRRPVISTSVCVTAWEQRLQLGSTMEFTGFDDSLNEKRLGALGVARRSSCTIRSAVRGGVDGGR